MTELRQSRWVKIHEPGQANYAETDNVMDIKIGGNRCQADVLYTVRSYKKAGYWLLKYLEAAEAAALLAEAAERIMNAVDGADREDPDVTVETDDWTCAIERMSSGAFKVSLTWQTDEPVVRKQTRKDKTVQKARRQETRSQENDSKIKKRASRL